MVKNGQSHTLIKNSTSWCDLKVKQTLNFKVKFAFLVELRILVLSNQAFL